jgi:SAM-dependent methyltransferase
VPRDARRILDLGTGDGRLLALLRLDRPDCVGVGLDVSVPMLKAARERFADTRGIELVRHDLAEPLRDLGSFDAVVSCFAIHHVSDTRKRMVYAEAFDRLEPMRLLDATGLSTVVAFLVVCCSLGALPDARPTAAGTRASADVPKLSDAR